MTPTSLPAGPRTPRLLQMIQWIRDPLGFMETTAQQFGDIFTVRVGATVPNFVFVSDPEAIRQILFQEAQSFSAPAVTNRILEPIIGSRSVILQEGQPHRRRRQLLMPPLHGERLRSYGHQICEVTHQIMAALPVDQPFSARSTLQQIFLEITLDVVFGITQQGSDATAQRHLLLREKLTQLVNLADSLWVSAALFFPLLRHPWLGWDRVDQLQQDLDQLLLTEIEERRANFDPDAGDILSLLLTAQDEMGEGLTDQELRDELITLLIAGLENTSSSLAWALYWIHRYPEIKTRLLQELDPVPTDQDPITLGKSPYLSAIIQETLRIYPPAFVAFPRRVESPITISGQDLQPGTIVILCIYLCHHRPDLYPDPHRFNPDRFLDRQYSPYEYLPYGGGTRRCVGDALAQLELKLTLTTLISHYEFDLLENAPVHPRRRGVTLAPGGGVRMRYRGTRQPTRSTPSKVRS